MPNSNQLDTLDSSSIGHDLAGNRISDQNGARTFEYNNAGRLFKVYENGSLIATYTYNYQGQRTRKVTTSGTTVYHYDLNGSLISETDELGAPVKDIVYRNTIPVAQIDVGLTSEFITYLHSDHLGTPRRGTDENGIVVWSWDSDAFGAAAANDDSDGDGVSTVVNLRFPGQYYDQETGLHYNYFRYYDPSTGRYVTSDPIGLNGGLNTYGYVGGNPLYSIDPSGLASVNYDDDVPASTRNEIERNLDLLEQALINQTSSCSGATDNFLDSFFSWNITVTTSGSPAGFAGSTFGRRNSTTIFGGRGSLGDLAHEFYHTTPENINRRSNRGVVDSSSAPSENGPYGAYDFEDSVNNGDCLCRYSTGEQTSPNPYRDHDSRPAWQRFFDRFTSR